MAEGLPRPGITWFVVLNSMDMEIPSTDQDFNISTYSIGTRQVMSTLKVNSVRPALAAMYSCNASNVVRDVTAGATLVVHSTFIGFKI